ncbi:MAG TPA: hypothetical protein VFB13_03990 [Reyranella sp.]|jgi:hypothetical protein|nr:hypothetical protein [Reyranella sp.]
MNHALSAVVMLMGGLLFTSCTATVVQHWAMNRQPAQADYTPPSLDGGERGEAFLPASAAGECKPEEAPAQHGQPLVPKFSPLRRGPKT